MGGLSAILQLPTSSMPASVIGVLPQLLSSVIMVCNAMQEDANQETEDGHVDPNIGHAAAQQDEWEDEDDEGFDENEDVRNEADAAYVEALNKLSATGDMGDMASFLENDWDDYDEDDDNFQSSWDNLNELIVFSDILRGAFQKEPEAYQQLQAALSPEALAICQRLFAQADKEKAEMQQAQAA